MGSLVARGNRQPPDLNDSSDDINLQNYIIKSDRYIKDIHLYSSFLCTLRAHTGNLNFAHQYCSQYLVVKIMSPNSAATVQISTAYICS